MTSEVAKLARLIARWNGKLVEASEKRYDRLLRTDLYSEAPFSHHSIGIMWHRKTIYYSGEICWTDLTHEMGHVFACPKAPDDEECDELSFFGWECALAKHIGADVAVWEKAQDAYQVEAGIGSFNEFGGLERQERDKVLADCMRVARELKSLDSRNRPRAIR
jgi:hypothetical protein